MLLFCLLYRFNNPIITIFTLFFKSPSSDDLYDQFFFSPIQLFFFINIINLGQLHILHIGLYDSFILPHLNFLLLKILPI